MSVPDRSRRASAILLVLAVLVLFAVLGMTFATLATLDSRVGRNYEDDLTTRREIGDHALAFLETLLAAERVYSSSFSSYDAVDANHRWLAGIRYDSDPPNYAWELSFRGSAGDSGEFNVTGAGRPYDGANWSDVNQDGIADGPGWAADGRFMELTGFGGGNFELALDPGGREHVECASIIIDLESRLNVNFVGNTSGLGESHGFAEGWGPHEISLFPLSGNAIPFATWIPGYFQDWPMAVQTNGALLEYLLVKGGPPGGTNTPIPSLPWLGRYGPDATAGAAGGDDEGTEDPNPETDWIDSNADGVFDRPFIQDGGDGVSNSTLLGDDQWFNGAAPPPIVPRQIIIHAGADGILQSTIGGDDFIVGVIRDGGNGVVNSSAAGDDQAVNLDADVPAGSIVIAPGPDGILDSTPVADDRIAGLRELIDEPDEMNPYSPAGDDRPYGVEDEIDLAAALIHPVEVIIEPFSGGDGVCNTTADSVAPADDVQVVPNLATAAPGEILIRPGANLLIDTIPAGDDMRVKILSPANRLAEILTHPWARHLVADMDADSRNNNMNLTPAGGAVDDESSEAAAVASVPQARDILTDLADNNSDNLIDNFSEGEDTLFRKLFTTVSCGDVWARRHGGTGYPLTSYVAWKETEAGGGVDYGVYEICKIPVNRINWGRSFFSAGGVELNDVSNDTISLLLDLFNAARSELGDDRQAAGLIVNLIDAFDRHEASGVRMNEGVTVMMYDTGATTPPADDPAIIDLRFADTVTANLEQSFATLNTWMADTDRVVVFGLEDRVPRISEIYYYDNGTPADPLDDEYAVEIYNPEPFEAIPLENWQLVVCDGSGSSLATRRHTFTNTDSLPAGDVLIVSAAASYPPGAGVVAWNGTSPMFGESDLIALVRRFATLTPTPPDVAPLAEDPDTGLNPPYYGVVTDAASVPSLASPFFSAPRYFQRTQGWRRDSWVEAASNMGAAPTVDDTTPAPGPNLELYFPDNPATRMPNLGTFGRIVDFQMAAYTDTGPGPTVDTIPTGSNAREAAFSRNLAESISAASPPTWDERWAVFYQFWDRQEPPAPGWIGNWRTPSSLASLMELVTVPAPHADGIDNDGDGAVDLADTGLQAGDRMGPEVRIPGQININTAGREVLRCLLTVLRLGGTAPEDADTFIAQIEAGRPYTSLEQVLDGSQLNLSTIEEEVETSGVADDDDGDRYANEPNEALFLRARLSNLVTVRSNTFLAYVASRYIDEGDRQLGIMAGSDFDCDTTALGDDVQLLAVGTTDLAPNAMVILPGPNRLLDTLPAAGDLCNISLSFAADGVIEPLRGGNGIADTTAAVGDDVQVVPVGNAVEPGQCIVSPGLDLVLDTIPEGDDRAEGLIVQPWAGAGTCESTAGGDDVQLVPVGGPCSPGQVLIDAGPNGIIQSSAAGDDIKVVTNGVLVIRTTDTTCDSAVTGDDIEVVAPPGGFAAGDIVILPGADGWLESLPGGDDYYDWPSDFSRDDSVYVRREIMVLDRASCARVNNEWIPQVRILARKVLSEYRKIPE